MEAEPADIDHREEAEVPDSDHRLGGNNHRDSDSRPCRSLRPENFFPIGMVLVIGTL